MRAVLLIFVRIIVLRWQHKRLTVYTRILCTVLLGCKSKYAGKIEMAFSDDRLCLTSVRRINWRWNHGQGGRGLGWVTGKLRESLSCRCDGKRNVHRVVVVLFAMQNARFQNTKIKINSSCNSLASPTQKYFSRRMNFCAILIDYTIWVVWGFILCTESVSDVSNEKNLKDDIYTVHRVQKSEKVYLKIIPSVHRNVFETHYIYSRTPIIRTN